MSSGIDYQDHDDPSSSFYNPNYTYSYDKYSCARGFFFAHIVFNYFVFLSGIGCLVTRIIPGKFRWMHSWLGRVYILSMLWSTCTSLLINNTGLPLSTLVSFAGIMIGLSIGWMIIVIYKQNMEKEATKLVQERLLRSVVGSSSIPNDKNGNSKSTGASEPMNLEKMLKDAKFEVASNKTFVQRLFSLKTLHGVLFFMTWFQIAGRIFASNQSGDFTCYTYPVYKPIDTPEGDYAAKNLTLVPSSDPNYDRLPWAALGPVAWSLWLIFGAVIGAYLVGAIWNYVDVRLAARKNSESEVDDKMGEVSSDSGRVEEGN